MQCYSTHESGELGNGSNTGGRQEMRCCKSNGGRSGHSEKQVIQRGYRKVPLARQALALQSSYDTTHPADV